MLTADHVRARRKGGELLVRALGADERERAVELAGAYLDIAKSFVGRRRADLDEAYGVVPIQVRDRRLANGLRKLIEDACEFDSVTVVDPPDLRSAVFSAASEHRRALDEGVRFDRRAVLERVSKELGISTEDAEKNLFADLRAEQILRRVRSAEPAELVRAYDRGQAQAVLLRAERVVAEVRCASPLAYRSLFRELKFRRLLHRVEPLAEGYRIEIDGPFSLFESVTKYGLELALVLPALEACDSLALTANVRWGKERTPLVFRHARKADSAAPSAPPRLREDVRALQQAFETLGGEWTVRESTVVLELPGLGVCVPDLVFSHGSSAEPVFFEALGFWSREAVFRRVDLIERGLSKPILFAVSSKLRVSEAVLDSADVAALYVYKGTMSARAVEKKLEELRARLKPRL